MADEVVEEYKSSLGELTFNSKVHINLLTMLAEENAQYSEHIVKAIEAHLQKVHFELFFSWLRVCSDPGVNSSD